MDRVFDRDNRFVGYVRDNEVFDRRHRIVGFIQEPMLLDAYYNPVAYYYQDVMYTPDGIPWAYYDGRVFRDMSGRRLGRTVGSWPGMLSGALLLGRGIGWYPATYENPAAERYSRNYMRNDYREDSYTQGRGRQDSNVVSGGYGPRGYEAAQYGTGDYRPGGFGGILQNVMGYGRSLLGGLGGGGNYRAGGYSQPGYGGAQAQPAGDPPGNTGGGYGMGSSLRNIIGTGRTLMGVFNGLGGINGLSGLLGGSPAGSAGSMQNMMGFANLLNGFGGQGAVQGAGAAGGLSGLGNLFSGMGPLGSMVGRYLMNNPQMAMSLLSKFLAR
ncbi:MAG: hypothetical protein Q8930_06485 [Bacillota bacterium]|nr:hypothetical protein [Bacillota bacterium]